MDFATANFFLNLIVQLKNWHASSTASRAEKRQALEAFENALVETEIYIKSIERKYGESDHMDAKAEKRDYLKEENLTKLWRTAAAKSNGLNDSIQKIAYAKSMFWMDRDNWTRAAVTQNGIAIENAKEAIKKLKL